MSDIFLFICYSCITSETLKQVLPQFISACLMVTLAYEFFKNRCKHCVICSIHAGNGYRPTLESVRRLFLKESGGSSKTARFSAIMGVF